MNVARASDRLSAVAGALGLAGVAGALAALLLLGGGCGKGSSDGGRAREERAARPAAASAADGAKAATPAPGAPPPVRPLLARPLLAKPEGLAGSLLLGEGAQLVRLDLANAALVELAAPGPELRLFPTDAVHGDVLAAVAVLDRLTEEGEAHGEQLALVDLSGKAPPRLVGPTAQVVRSPSFSADGKSLFFEASHQSFRDIYRLVLPAAGATGEAALGQTVRITDNRDGNFAPALSADGKTLAFASSRDGDSELYAVDVAGLAPRSGKPGAALPPARRLTAFHRDDWGVAWSRKDPGELAFLSDREGAERIFTLRGDGTGLRRATQEDNPLVSEAAPAWSASGALAFLRSQGGRGALVAGAPGTSSWRTLTPEGAKAGATFAWSPDGRWLAAVEVPLARPGETLRAHPLGRLTLYAADGSARLQVLELAADATIRWIR